ncbi:MAG: NADH-quinone oxidoreductase subunit NuoE [Candidatus Omnitrophica bacterium]|nr:NADH-quinone oxidoreductase subunit NuoE [Candidatus Omnitrophota bacterium]
MKQVDLDKETDKIVDRYNARITGSVSILQDIQALYHYLPKEALIRVAERLNIPLSQVFSLATFYKAFTLKPHGKHLVCVCLGTACHVRGAHSLVDELQRRLKIKPGETTKDNKFTLAVVNCLGCCAIGPVMVIDDKYYEHVRVNKIDSILNKY